MNIFNTIKKDIKKLVSDILGIPQEEVNASVETPKNPEHGDIATNVAMTLSKRLAKNPREIAESLLPSITELEYVTEAKIDGPGFINMFLDNSILYAVLRSVLLERENFGSSDIGGNRKINVEFVSANPTGPMHVGHTRNAIFGDVLCNLFTKAGYDVYRDYIINDAGSQIKVLVRSAYARYLQALGEDIEIPEGCYPGEYLIPVGEALAKKYGDSLRGKDEEYYAPEIRDFVMDEMLALVKQDLELLNVRFDRFLSEKKELHDTGAIKRGVEYLKSKDLAYVGKLDIPKGEAPPEDYEPQDQTIFRSSKFGDTEDRVILKHDGTPAYFAADVAYVKNKLDMGFEELYMVLAVDHCGYVRRLEAITSALSGGKVPMYVELYNLIRLFDNGVSIKMSKRSGKFLTARDVIEEVGADILRFIMMTRQANAPLDFDFQKVKEMSSENPVFYVQYASARCNSALRKAESEEGLRPNVNADLTPLTLKAELDIIRKMAEYPKMIESAAMAAEPHKITFYLQELSAMFHSLWNMKDSFRIIGEDRQLTEARLCLIEGVRLVIKSGLGLLGVEALEEMK